MATDAVDKKLTLREHMALKILMIMFVVIKPFDWNHEIKEAITEIKNALKEEK